MSDPVPPVAATLEIPQGEGPGGHIGPFKILQQIGEGGFGDVFEAEQEQPVKRRVALKVIKLGMDTREVIARFEAERQALALMDHPHIASVFDAGATATGRPYFVMELVKGEPITTYCTRHGLSIDARLQLFEQVCEAVQHAHTKGIIHRDLKPNNVLVGRHDDRPFAKVIDFGIAKATSGRLTDKTLFTEANLMMGTPLYMSPEQAEGSADIDTRTDIYSLGVILYELLTDTTPIDSDTLRTAGYTEVQRIIREVEPPRPSARMLKPTTTRVGVDAKLRGDSRKMTKMMRADLDWIVMKAIEKDRTRRYETANGLATDIRRYRAGEAVLAAPPSAAYRLQKVVRRNKVVVAAGALVAASLIVGIVGFAWQAHIANARAAELEQVSKFQAAMLGQVDPTAAGKLLSDDVQAKFAAVLEKADLPPAERERQVAGFSAQWQRVNATDTATDLIDRTILKPAIIAIDKQFKAQPLVDASLRQVLADRYVGMGLYDAAMPLQTSALATRRRVLGAGHADTLESIEQMGMLLDAQGKAAAAMPYISEALATRRRTLGDNDPATLTAVAYMGQVLRDQGKLQAAEPYIREALQQRRRLLGEDDLDTVNSLSDMGGLLVDEGKLDQAEPYLRDVATKLRRTSGDDNFDTMRAINNIGIVLSQEGKRHEAEPYLREALEKHRRLLGENHPDTLQSTLGVGGNLLDEDKFAEAEPYLREAVDKCRRVLGIDHPSTLTAMSMLGKSMVEQKRDAEALALLAPAEKTARNVLPAFNPLQFAFFMATLGNAHRDLNDYAAAEPELLEAQSTYMKARGADDERTRTTTQSLVQLYTAWNKAEPGKGHDSKAAQWQQRLAAMDAKNAATRK